MTYTGRVMSVETRNLSEPTVAAAIVGATTLYVNDASTFDEAGGLVLVNGESLAYTAIDIDLDAITLAAALTTAVDEQELVEVVPATPVKTALVSLDDSGDSIEVVVPHTLLDKMLDGTRDDATAESVTLERRGAYEWLIADAPAKPLEQASLDYIEGEVGYGLTEAGVQVKDMQATGEVGAAVVSADQINLGGTDLVSILAPVPGATKYALKSGTTFVGAGPVTTTELRMFVFDAGPVKAGRVYDVGVRGLVNGTVAGDAFWIFLRYTTDGTDPTTASARLPGGQTICGPMPAGLRADLNNGAIYAPATDHPLKIAVTAQRQNGTGSLTVRTDVPEAAFQVWTKDLGVDSDSSTALQQTLKSDGSGSDNPTETTKTLSIQPTHVENWPGFSTDVGAAFYSDTGVADIGWVQDITPTGSDRPGFAVLHFNHASIVSALSTASSIVSVQLKFKVKSRLGASGLDLSIFAHKYASFPHSLAGNYASEVSAARIITAQGSKNDAAPGSVYTITLNTAVGTNLKSGLYKGIGITTTTFTAAGVGAIFANPSVDRPTLIITYKAP